MDTEEIKKRGKALFLAAALLCGAAEYPGAEEAASVEIVKARPAEPGITADAGEQPEETAAIQTAAPALEEPDSRIDLNKAGSDQLQSLKGIGPAKAAAILAYREDYGGFVCAEEITQVKGIGPATYEKIKDQIYVETDGTGQDQRACP